MPQPLRPLLAAVCPPYARKTFALAGALYVMMKFARSSLQVFPGQSGSECVGAVIPHTLDRSSPHTDGSCDLVAAHVGVRTRALIHDYRRIGRNRDTACRDVIDGVWEVVRAERHAVGVGKANTRRSAYA